MKAYAKPAMMALSISANDMLCGSCTAKTREDPELNTELQYLLRDRWTDTNKDSIVQENEAATLFGLNEDCQCSYKDYCKYNGAQTSILFSS